MLGLNKRGRLLAESECKPSDSIMLSSKHAKLKQGLSWVDSDSMNLRPGGGRKAQQQRFGGDRKVSILPLVWAVKMKPLLYS